MSSRVAFREAVFSIVVLGALTAYLVLTDSSYLFTYNQFLLVVVGAVALNMLMGTAGLVSIGNPAFMLVGSYAVVIARNNHVPLPLALLLAAVASAIAGAIIGLPAIRLRGLELSLATLAGLFILAQLASNYEKSHGAGTIGFLFTPLYASKGLDGAQHYWAWTLLAVDAAIIAVAARLMTGRSGRAWRMLRDQESVASACGIPVIRYKLMAFSLSSAIIGLQGGLLAYFSGSVTFEYFTFKLAVAYLAMVMIGGLDSVAGAVIGAGVVTWLPVLVPKLVSSAAGATGASRSAALSTIIYGVLVVVFIMSSSSGIVGLGKSVIARLRRGAAGGQSDTPGGGELSGLPPGSDSSSAAATTA